MKHPSLQSADPSGLAGGPAASNPTLRRRLRVQLHKGRLDLQLAEGFGSDPIEDRALRARQLDPYASPPPAGQFASRTREGRERPPGPRMSAAVPVAGRAVRTWRESLLGLAERLERPDPVNPCGVARVLLLLTDAAGPLYNPGALSG